MWLVIDMGNSRGKWGLAAPGSTDLLRTGSFDMAADMNTVLEHQDLPLDALTQVLICCVAREARYEQVVAWLKAKTRATVRRFTSRTRAFGVTNGYRNPGQLGADRWAALLAARELIRGPVLVADCGSAVTLDLLAADGRHLGGYILPGLSMMRRALHRETAGLPEVASGKMELADNTSDAIGAGTLLGIVMAIESVVARNHNPPCLLTGGDAETIGRYLQAPCQHEPDLVLKGLVIAGDEQPDS